ncbi:hypothetical protein Q31a_26690 [Aureliella helgolandensis]|uniref:DUF3352 domain-containing protein n=2 Tax=Aureliella helgolandensis TaxID=2527968 RepID=A0A518G6Y5_9BACT|nr:hypothetical protein Q31a_26690 [Aureliella helgolandensis]
MLLPWYRVLTTTRASVQRLQGWSLHTLLIGVLIAGISGQTASAQATATSEAPAITLADTALTLAPQDAAFFMTNLNMQAGWRELANGNFVTRLRAVPFIQQLETEFNTQWENPQGELATAKGMLDNVIVQDVLRLLQEMASQEMFIYGGDDWCEAIQGVLEFQNEFTSKMSEGPEAIQSYVNGLTKADFDRIQIPTTVLGFRIVDDANARQLLDSLEAIIRLAGMQAEELQPLLANLLRADLEDGQTLTLLLNSSVIPAAAFENMDEEEAEIAQKFMEFVEGRSLSLTLGIRSNMVLLVMSEDIAAAQAVGENDTSLLDHEHLELLSEVEPSQLRSIAFTSKRWREAQWNASFHRYFERVGAQLGLALGSDSDLGDPEELQAWHQDILEDARWMDQQLQELGADSGDMLAWSTSTDAGYEGYGYDWSQNRFMTNAAPLSILDYAGTAPIILFGIKQQPLTTLEKVFEHLLDRAPYHVRKIIQLAESDSEESEKALLVFDQAWPLAQEAYEIYRDRISPSLKERETLLSIAAQWSTDTLNPNFPKATPPLPLPEVAIACRVTNREMLIEGCVELFGLMDRVLDLVREMNPNAVPPEYSIPRPTEESIAGGSRYFYPELNNEVPLEGFSLQLALTEDVLVVGYSDRQIADMLRPKPLRTRPAWLTPTMPVAAVSYADYAAMFAAFRPWIEYGITMSTGDLDAPLFVSPGPIPTGNDVLQIWDCFSSAGKAAATVSLNEQGVTVTHWFWSAK